MSNQEANSDSFKNEIKEQLAEIPDEPGVYQMKDISGEIIYIGKAKSLRRRIRSYFQAGNHTYKTRVMVKEIRSFDYIVTDTEVEAYILEASLIKKYGPKYNIRLKDDKSYPYIKITSQEDFPRIFKTRIIKKDGSDYFGPYVDVDAVYKTIELTKDIFQLRSCKKEIVAGNPLDKPCLNFHIEKCSGPCIGEISQADYQARVEKIARFLQGNHERLLKEVEKKMLAQAEKKQYEKAAYLRDGLEALEELARQQKVITGDSKNRDFLAVISAAESDLACVQVLIVRNGNLIGQDYMLLEGARQAPEKELISSFIQQYYNQTEELPEEILVNILPADKKMLVDSLGESQQRSIKIKKPARGQKRRLLQMALRNAEQNLQKSQIKHKYQRQRSQQEITELQEYLELETSPRHVEGFDISNLQGTDAVASLVVFKNGQPDKSQYRRFKIRTKEGPDDYAMMREVVGRRYSRILAEDKPLPDLIVIDGGKGQLNAAVKELDLLGLAQLDIIGLAKREEEVFLPGQKEPVIIPPDSPALHLLQRVRDEAHRFAVNYHRRLRSRRLTHSMLDQIPGIGPARREALLEHFGSLAKIRSASREDLQQVSGISTELSQVIRNYLDQHVRPI